VTDPREAQIATWTAMRRGGKLRHVCTNGLFAGAVMAAAMTAVVWMKTGTIQVAIEAIVAFVVAAFYGAASARTVWNRFESIYPDIGIKRDS
jgi:hypothetical protein